MVSEMGVTFLTGSQLNPEALLHSGGQLNPAIKFSCRRGHKKLEMHLSDHGNQLNLEIQFSCREGQLNAQSQFSH